MSFLQRIFRRPDYKSDVTLFIEELKAKRPDLEAQQRAGRALLWDKHLNREVLDEFRAGRVAPKAYAYQTAPKK